MPTEKFAVLFPGIGYHADKPLLYYPHKLLRARGYAVMPLSYGSLPQDKQGAFDTALSAARAALDAVDWRAYNDILFVSKSLGTCVSGVLARELKAVHPDLPLRQVLLTPVTETLPLIAAPAVAFSGTADPLVEQSALEATCRTAGVSLFRYPDANHSIETGDVARDLDTVKDILHRIADFL